MAVLFSAADRDYHPGLWISNGTAGGTRQIHPAGLTDAFLFVGAIAPIGPELLFAASNLDGLGLWSTDGTDAGTRLIATLNSGIATASSFVQAGGKWFTTVNVNGVSQLWITDGSAAGTQYLTTVDRSITQPDQIADAGDGKFVFAKTDAAGDRELWVTDGTAAGTHLLKDIDPRSYADNTGEPIPSSPLGFITLNGKALFGVFMSFNGLYQTDGTADGTIPIATHRALGRPTFTVAYDGGVVFATRSTSDTAQELWTTDGTAAGTHVIKTFGADPDNILITDFAATAAGLFFNVMDSSTTENDSGLWVTDGTTAGTTRLTSAAGSDVTMVGGKFVFHSGGKLWASDGTEAGTSQIGSLAVDWGLPTFVRLGGLAYFSADDGSHGKEFWVTDGTQAGTHLVKDINPGGDAAPALMHEMGGKLYFQATDGTHGTELWVSDGTAAGTHILKDINTTGSGNSDPQLFYNLNIAPSGITLSTPAVTENAAKGIVVGTLKATDFDLTDTHTFTLLNNAGARFALQGDKIVVADKMLLDFEQAKSHAITVRATDQGGKFVDKVLTITVTDAAAENVTGDARGNKIVGGAGNDSLSGGAGNDTLAGGGGNDKVWGGDGADQLSGGIGNDLLTGGAGMDQLQFNSKPAARNFDTITDFVRGQDHIVLENAIFAKLGAAGGLRAAFFKLGAAADANDYIVYDAKSGALSYDADGYGVGAAIKFAVLQNKPALTATDFLVF